MSESNESPVRRRRRSVNYVNNRDMFDAFVAHQAAVAKAQEAGELPPRVPEYIGVCIKAIATNLSNKPNFSRYPFKSEMVADGIENSLMYMHNFNPEKSNNPFAYFTQIIKNAFIRRITLEKQQLYIKYKMMQHMSAIGDGVFSTQGHDSEMRDSSVKMSDGSAEYMNDFIRSFEDAKAAKAAKADRRKKGPLETFLEDHPNE